MTATYARRVSAHECTKCGVRLADDRKGRMCPACAAVRTAMFMEMQRKRAEAGLCIRCGYPSDDGRKMCDFCRKRHNALQNERNRRLREKEGEAV